MNAQQALIRYVTATLLANDEQADNYSQGDGLVMTGRINGWVFRLKAHYEDDTVDMHRMDTKNPTKKYPSEEHSHTAALNVFKDWVVIALKK